MEKKVRRPRSTPLEAGRKPRKTVAAPQKRTLGAESSRKLLSLLVYFEPSRPFASIETLAQAIDVPKSTAYRYVSLLREFGFIAEAESGLYSLGPRALVIARAAQAVNYLEVARPVMERLSHDTGETALLARRVGDHCIFIERTFPSDPVRLFVEIGTAHPLHIGASPKLLLAHLPPRERDGYLARASETDPALKTHLDKLVAELERIRKHGAAITIDEITPTILAVSAPILDAGKVVAALSIAGPSFRIDRPKRIAFEALVKQAAADISAQLALRYG
jgi:DNA-binding IclR family transcriptional regulator